MTEPYVNVQNLTVAFQTGQGLSIAIDGVSFDINKGEIVGIVGESGSGKTVASKALMRLLDCPPADIRADAMEVSGESVLNKTEREMCKIRGDRMSMVFQEPMTSLNPVLTIKTQLCEVLRIHRNLNKKESVEQAVDLLRLVGIPEPEKRLREYPHSLSGGMRQRVMIAMALACRPDLLIADEPTTALDVTIQAQILDLIKRLQKEFSTSIMLITHDLGIVAEMASRVVVMYAGNIMEKCTVEQVFTNAKHPYTKALLECIPTGRRSDGKLRVIPGTVPNAFEYPKGCRFQTRCEHAKEICRENKPGMTAVEEGHELACWLYASEQTPESNTKIKGEEV
ncbi:MAG: ABC transporter ATP-binding protein [Peptococcaceae bacterium]|jgi:oligopeptide/dipeptide ABC transporter ATP-binding protein|nr:ABC transporter ATP-binding protein [Peptococcaceae bacterium]